MRSVYWMKLFKYCGYLSFYQSILRNCNHYVGEATTMTVILKINDFCTNVSLMR